LIKIQPFFQGELDSLCGVYSICNAYQIVKKSDNEEIEKLFIDILLYLQKRKKLVDVLVGGMYQSEMSEILKNVVKDSFIEVIQNFQWSGYDINEFWKYSKKYLENDNSAIVLSIGGRENHYTVVERMTDNTIFLSDSSGIKTIRKNQCEFYGYKGEDKYILHPNGSFFVKG